LPRSAACSPACSASGCGSRRRAARDILAATAVAIAAYFAFGGISSTVFYALCALGGITTGYWAVFVSTAAELFGTNLRATVTTTVRTSCAARSRS